MKLNNANIVDKNIPGNTLKKQNGFTLLEVVIALTIFAVGLLAIAAMQTSAIRMNYKGNRITELSALGIDRFERLMSLPYNQLTTGSDAAPPAGYTISWQVTPNVPAQDTSSVTLRVTASGGKFLQITGIRSRSL